MRSFHLLAALLVVASASAQTPPDSPLSAEAIMARVAANQDATESARATYVYIQHARVLSLKGNKIMCEEITDSRITPSGKSSHQELLKLNGRVLKKSGYTTYNTPSKQRSSKITIHPSQDPIQEAPDDLDVDLVEDLRSSFTNDDTKDGLGSDLFPLTTEEQKGMTFTLVGREQRNGRSVFHITFRPKDKSDADWKGDAYIDTEAFQPVLVSTAMAHKIPFAVRTVLGTSLPGLGFTVTYAPQQDGVWFPTTFGTEFKLNVLFFLHRQIVIASENRDFEKTHVSSHILTDTVQPTTPKD
jgi:hypothetical protein